MDRTLKAVVQASDIKISSEKQIKIIDYEKSLHATLKQLSVDLDLVKLNKILVNFKSMIKYLKEFMQIPIDYVFLSRAFHIRNYLQLFYCGARSFYMQIFNNFTVYYRYALSI